MERGGRNGGTAAPIAPLFGSALCEFHPTGAARIAALARRPYRARSVVEQRAEEERVAIERLRSVASELASGFGLRFAAIEAEREGVNEHYGICYSDGRIRIRLRHAVTGRLLKESSLIDTLCHELAHLRHFDHSPRFRRFHLRILAVARRRGYYRPGPEPRVRVRQGSLFDYERDATNSACDRRPADLSIESR